LTARAGTKNVALSLLDSPLPALTGGDEMGGMASHRHAACSLSDH
jgi:hypothetical protein